MTDALGWKAKIGIVMPSTNTVVQPECDDLRPVGVTNHIGRAHLIPKKLEPGEQALLAHMEAMRAGIGAAIDRVVTCKPDYLVMGVALEAFAGGVAASEALTRELAERAGVPVSIGSTATCTALNAYGAKRIAILTPHQPEGDEVVRAYMIDAGFEVVRLKGFKCPSPMAIAEVSLDDIRKSLHELDGDDVDALVQVGTNLAGMRVAAETEPLLGKPVLSINAVTYWHALRALKIDDRVSGCGRILEEF